jgi:hypothetical protein
VKKYNEAADEVRKATFARTRPMGVKMFESEGFKISEEIEVPYEDFGMDGESRRFMLQKGTLVALRCKIL